MNQPSAKNRPSAMNRPGARNRRSAMNRRSAKVLVASAATLGAWHALLITSCNTRAENSYEEGTLPATSARDIRRSGSEAQAYIPATRLKGTEIANASCSRAERCNHVGPSKSHQSMAECRTKFLPKAGEDNAAWCQTGVDPVRLRECVAAIESEPCDAPIGAVERLGKCEEGYLCARNGTLAN